MDLDELTDLYLRRKEERETKVLDFYAGRRNWLILQRPTAHVWGECNTVEDICANNWKHMESWLRFPWTDELPHLSPWIGVGVYANAFGSEYLWRKGEAPDARTRYASIEEVRALEKPDWRRSPVMAMVLRTIDRLKETTKGRFPISTTDPQSPFDTATLVLDTSEFFTACYTEEEAARRFVGLITDLFIEFTRVQWERIGEGLAARPGHSIPSHPSLSGVTISDDNLAVSSPLINERIALPADRRIAEAFGGLFIHSCGTWDRTMGLLKGYGATGVDCAVHPICDPTPNAPEAVRGALQGSGIAVKVRFGPDIDGVLRDLGRIAGPGLRLMVDVLRTERDDARYEAIAGENYRRASEKLSEIYRE